MTASSTLNKGINNNIAALNISPVILKIVSRTARLKLTVEKVKKIYRIGTSTNRYLEVGKSFFAL